MDTSKIVRFISFVFALGMLTGCGTVTYYSQAVAGHVEILQAAKPIDELLADPGTSANLKVRLIEIKQIRAFASRALGLPDNASYQSYADIKRPFAVWNVFATPELSLKLMEWCYPVTGCVTYRGYYSKEAADAYADELRRQGWDVQVSGVAAYSTLGYTADPVLSTFASQNEGEVARLIFHELAHQVVYVPGDTSFNESFATAVEEEGVGRWLGDRSDPVLNQSYRQYSDRKKSFVDLLVRSRQRLQAGYAEAENDNQRRVAKKREFAALRAEYARLKTDVQSPLYHYSGYDRYFAQDLNNAHLASMTAYTQWLPAFAQLLHQAEGDLPDFYGLVRQLAALSQADRKARLQALDASVKIQIGQIEPVNPE